MNQLTEQLRTADRICTQAYPYFEQAVALRADAEAKVAKSRKNKKIFTIVSILAILTFVPSISTPLVAVFGTFGGVLSLPVMIAAGLFLYKGVLKPFIERSAQRNEDEYVTSVSRADEAEAAGNDILTRHASALAVIPEEYRYPMATGYLLKVVETGRAENINQALQMYDEQLHRWNVESANAEILSQQEAQTQALKGIRRSSAINAAANVTNAAVNISRWF